MTRRVLTLVAFACLIALAGAASAGAYSGTSLDDNVSPASQTHGLADKWPSNRFGLDHHIGDIVTKTTVKPLDALPIPLPDALSPKVSVPTGVDYDALQASSRHTLAETIWDASRWAWNLIITLITFALSLDLLSGPNSVLAPIAASTHRLYQQMSTGWMEAAVVCLGIYILVAAIFFRKITQTAGKVAISFCMVAFALFIMTQWQWAVGGTSRYINQVSLAVIGAVNGDNSANAKTAATNVLFDTGVIQPFLVLNFGGLEHCVDNNGESVKPKSSACTNGGTLINNRKYLKPWLDAGPPGSPGRQLEYEAIRDGKVPDASAISDADLPANAFDGYKLSKADTPAVDIQGREIAGDRLITALLIGFGTLGALLTIGGLAVGIIVATLRAIFLFAGTVAVVILAMFPGAGHRGFWWWLERLALSLTYALWYSFILAIVLAITQSTAATLGPEWGWKWTYGIIAVFWWSMFLLRKRAGKTVMRMLPGSTGVHDNDKSLGDRAQSFYYKSRALKALAGATGAGAAARTIGRSGRAVKSSASAGKGVMRGGVDEVKDRANQYAGAAGHTEQFHETADLHGRALDDLEREHKHNTGRHHSETQNRARYDELAGRHRAAQDNPIPEDVRAGMNLPSLHLSKAEQREMGRLERSRMPQEEYVALRDTVGDVERRRIDTKGQPFSTEQITQRAERIRQRDQRQNDLASRAKHYAEHEHAELFPDSAPDRSRTERSRRQPTDHQDKRRERRWRAGNRDGE